MNLCTFTEEILNEKLDFLCSKLILLQVAILCEIEFVIKTYLIMTATTNVIKLQRYKRRFYLIVELTLSIDYSSNIVKEIENLSPNFK